MFTENFVTPFCGATGFIGCSICTGCVTGISFCAGFTGCSFCAGCVTGISFCAGFAIRTSFCAGFIICVSFCFVAAGACSCIAGCSEAGPGFAIGSSSSFIVSVFGSAGNPCCCTPFTYSFGCAEPAPGLCFTETPADGTLIFIPGIIKSGLLSCAFIFFNSSKSTPYFFAIFQRVSPFCTI